MYQLKGADKLKIIFLGTPEFARCVLESLNSKYEIKLVISQPNREKKKGQYIDTPVAMYAKENNLQLLQPESIKDIYDVIKDMDADTLITAAYGQYIPTKILNLFKTKLNVHASLLPLHRGGAPIQRCLINGDTKTGVTIMEMEKRLDAGKIYAKEEYIIDKDDDASSLFSKLAVIGSELLLDNIEDIYNGINQGYPQDDSLATFSPNLTKEEEKIDFNRNSKDIINQIRGLSKNPGAYILVNNIVVKVYKAEEVNYSGIEVPGTVLNVKKGIVIKTLDSAISLTLLKQEGKKELSGKDFSNGQKLFIINDII